MTGMYQVCKGRCSPPERLAAALGVTIIKRMACARNNNPNMRYGNGDWYCGSCQMMIRGWKGTGRCPCCRVLMRQMYRADGTPTGRAVRIKRRADAIAARQGRTIDREPRPCAGGCGAVLPFDRRAHRRRERCERCQRARNLACTRKSAARQREEARRRRRRKEEAAA